MSSENDIAIVGMALRVPGALSLSDFWRNLSEGRESLRSFSAEELRAEGISPALLENPGYVRAGMTLAGYDEFDAGFFGFSPKEAAILDPQHRQFYEVAWEALENAGCVPERFERRDRRLRGLRHRHATSTCNVLRNPDLMRTVGYFLLRHTGNDKDFLATRVSYAFDLRGPSLSVQTACSTSLVATHLAVQSLLARECDMALAGGVTIELPQRRGLPLPRGRDPLARRPLPRLRPSRAGHGLRQRRGRRRAAPACDDALRDGDHIHAVIKGQRGQQRRRRQGRLPGAQRRGPGRGDRRGASRWPASTAARSATSNATAPARRSAIPIEVAALTQAFAPRADAKRPLPASAR